uniref:BspA family leucine-rich repeat surface protein n=1 Tax=viral metagenome TaxID=1070528 RepID=A0A6C0I8Y7_9ZZZZ
MCTKNLLIANAILLCLIVIFLQTKNNFGETDSSTLSIGDYVITYDPSVVTDTTSIKNVMVLNGNTININNPGNGAWANGIISIVKSGITGTQVNLPTDCNSLFKNCTTITEIDAPYWDTTQVTDMSAMFNGCNSLISLDLSGWKTDKVKNMRAMFNGCSKIQNLQIFGWITDMVTDMNSMFAGCVSIISLNLGSGWKTDNVTDMKDMFSGCCKIKVYCGNKSIQQQIFNDKTPCPRKPMFLQIGILLTFFIIIIFVIVLLFIYFLIKKIQF